MNNEKRDCYSEIFDPRLNDSIRATTVDSIGCDGARQPFPKLEWMVKGTSKARNFVEYKEEKISGFSGYVGEVGNRTLISYRRTEKEPPLLIELNEGNEDATVFEVP